MGEGHFFILSERIALPGGAVEERSFTGRWRQADGGAVVRLSGRQGFSRQFSLGRSGDLYGHMGGGRSMPVSVRFARTCDTPRPYALGGTLLFDQGGASVRDAASGRVTPLEGDARLEELAARGVPLFAEMDVLEEGGRMRLIRLRSVSARLPASILREMALPELAVNGPWRFAVQDLPPLDGAFTWLGGGRGELSLSGQGLRLRVPCETRGESLAFTVTEHDAAMLRAAGFPALSAALEAVRLWDMEGDLLVLYSGAGCVATMERITPGDAPGRGWIAP